MTDSHARLRAHLAHAYGIVPAAIADAPRGFVADTYDISSTDGRRYFAKHLPLWADADAVLAGVPVLEELHALGIDSVSHPLRTLAGEPAATLDDRPFFLFDFIAGERGAAGDASLSPASFNYDFADYVHLLARIHAVTPRLRCAVPQEDFTLPWAAEYEALFQRAVSVAEPSPDQERLRHLLEQYRSQIDADWSELRSLVDVCRDAGWSPVLTHGDGTGINVIVGDDRRLYLIDWDVPLLAPAERDTWFFLNTDAAASVFLPLYRRAFPDYRPNLMLHRYYVLQRFFQDITGYLGPILDDPSPERQAWHLAELRETCFTWLWPAMRRLDGARRPLRGGA
jgi:aminoglycoside phosphotransferase (APT) family kinase protein